MKDFKGTIDEEIFSTLCPDEEGVVSWGDGATEPLYHGHQTHTYPYNGSYKVEVTCAGPPLLRDTFVGVENVNDLGERPTSTGLLGNLGGVAALVTAIVGVLTFIAGRASKKNV